jgi:hypothetical protein
VNILGQDSLVGNFISANPKIGVRDAED